VTVAKSLWAAVQGDPVFMRRVNGWLTMFWLAMIPVSLATGWVKSVTYVSALSLWALVSGHWSAWQAARVEVNQQEEDIAGQVVEQVGREDRRRAGLRRRDGWRRSIRACRRVRRLDMRAHLSAAGSDPQAISDSRHSIRFNLRGPLRRASLRSGLES
jgi:hypothetical protein